MPIRSGLRLYARYRSLSLGTRILLFMALGGMAGAILGERATAVEFLGEAFIRLLLMAAIPLVLFNLLGGITSLTTTRSLGRLGFGIGVYYLTTTVVALALGAAVIHVSSPGAGLELSAEVDAAVGSPPRLIDVLLGLLPANVARAVSTGDLVQVVVFALLLGAAGVALPDTQRRSLAVCFEDVAAALRKMVELLLEVAPLGIGALAAVTVGRYGRELVGPLTTFVLGVWSAQAVMVVLYMISLSALTGRSPAAFLKTTAPLYATTAATCSSLASLVVAMDIAEQRLHLPRGVYSFTLPLGAQVHKDGSAVMLAGALVLTAQAAGVTLSLSALIPMLFLGVFLLAGSGGIPGGGLVIALIYVQAFHLPLEIVAIVGGIYRLLDMGNTTVNIMGDLVGTTIVAHAGRRSGG